jgi:hypothetical protein
MSGTPLRRPIPPIYRCAAGCVGPDGLARKVGNAGDYCRGTYATVL